MKILFVHDYGTLNGGAEYMTRTLRDGLRKHGHEAAAFTSSAQPLPAAQFADYHCYGTMSFLRRFTQVANPSAHHQLSNVLRDFQPDIVHVRMFMTQLSPLILPLLRDYQSLLHIVNYDLICPLNTKVLPDGSPCHVRAGFACKRNGCLPYIGVGRRLAQTALWQRWSDVFDLVVANSASTQQRLEADGISVDKVVWNGVPERSRRPPLKSTPTVGFSGRFVTKKGLDVLIRAMTIVLDKIPQARLIIVGDGPQKTQIRSLIEELGIEESVSLRGFIPRDQLEDILAPVWVHVVPSRWEEPFGLVTAEAMMRGTATVVSDKGGSSELVEDGVTGFKVPAGDEIALARAIIEMLSDRDLAERMGTAGREFALDNLTEDNVVDRFIGLYQTLSKENSAW